MLCIAYHHCSQLLAKLTSTLKTIRCQYGAIGAGPDIALEIAETEVRTVVASLIIHSPIPDWTIPYHINIRRKEILQCSNQTNAYDECEN